jgi:trimeric autotransporter adhesin
MKRTILFLSVVTLMMRSLFAAPNHTLTPEFEAMAKSVNAPMGDVGGPVTAMLVHDGKLYVGGRFEKVDRRVVNNVAVWDGTKWSGLAKGVDGKVYAMAAVGKDIYVSGDFSVVDKTDSKELPANGIARWDGTKWNALGKQPAVDQRIYALATDGKNLFVAGRFNTLGGGTVEASNVAVWNGSTFKALTKEKFDNPVMCLTYMSGKLYAGGYFTLIGDEPAANIAVYDGKGWSELGKNGLASKVSVLTHDGKNIYAAGEFTKAGDGTVTGAVAIWNGTKWNGLFADQCVSGLSTSITGLSFDAGTLYIAGTYYIKQSSGDSKEVRFSKWDGKSLSVMKELIYTNFHSAAVFKGEPVAGAAEGSGTIDDGVQKYSGDTWKSIGTN